MDKPSFTPGPWQVGDVTETDDCHVHAWIRPVAGGDTGCAGAGRYMAVSGIMTMADARLIAAAPEMFEALKALRAAFMTHTQWSGEPPAEVLAADAALSRAGEGA